MTLATEQDAVREWAWNVGYEDCYKDRQWICSNYDTWERNPHYHGPEQQHPEAEYEYDFAEQQRIELQNASGVDMPNLGCYRDWIDFSGCISFPEVVPF